MKSKILAAKTTTLTIGSNILSMTECEAVINISLNGRKFSNSLCEKAFIFAIKNQLTHENLLICIASILNHPNQLSLDKFIILCLNDNISFVFLGDRAGVGSKERVRDVFSFDSLEEIKAFSEDVALMSITPPKEESVEPKRKHKIFHLAPDHLFTVTNDSSKKDYSNNYSIRGKNGRFIKESPMEKGTRIHENWEKVFNAHTPPPIPTDYNYYKNLKLGTPEYAGSRQFVKNYVIQNKVSVKEAIKVFNQGVADFGAQFESLVKNCPNLVPQVFPPLSKVETYMQNYERKNGYAPSVKMITKRFKEYLVNQVEWRAFLEANSIL